MKKKFQDFFYLLEKRTALFSVDELTDLKRRISQLPNNIEQLSNALEDWFKGLDKYRNADYHDWLPLEMMGDDRPPLPPDQDYLERLKKVIDNAIPPKPTSSSQSSGPNS